MDAGPSTPFRFGAFEVDPEAGELRKNGVLVRLPPQPFRLLLLLATHSGHVVSREDIKKQLWGEETFVDFDQGVNFSIRQIREALGDTAEGSRYVQTVPRRGYKFLTSIEPLASAVATADLAAAAGAGSKPPGTTDVILHKALWANIAELRMAEQRRRRLLIALTVAIVLLALVLGLKVLT
jgi:DNA-binding winged helix-turn-helix (wHTH) protein